MTIPELYPPASITEADRPITPPSLLSVAEKDRLIERGFLGLYRWYMARSQETRNWNADKSFDWKSLRTDFTPEVTVILEGFFAVEQYVPDFTASILNTVRRSHGRSHFTLRWGFEEERHADTWENAVLFSKGRTPKQIEEYKYLLRSKEWQAPWDSALYNLIYTVFQERATQLNYLNLAKIVSGKSDKVHLQGNEDPILTKVAQTIAVDEAAHYNFFLECARLFLYYYPEKTLEAIKDVIHHFAMPAYNLVPDWAGFSETVYKAGIYGPRELQRDVIQVVFRNMGIESRKKLEEGIKRTRIVPLEGGGELGTAIWDSFDYGLVEGDVRRLYTRVADYEQEIGFADIDPTVFVRNPEVPSSAN